MDRRATAARSVACANAVIYESLGNEYIVTINRVGERAKITSSRVTAPGQKSFAACFAGYLQFALAQLFTAGV